MATGRNIIISNIVKTIKIIMAGKVDKTLTISALLKDVFICFHPPLRLFSNDSN